ncbi:zinc finger CCCH domain-containing protein 13 isoform X2 [Euphorbia lathyris]|uniref:zinc finger CCCH domain-containing protein 13 isoform X2 n=1 Tax=Euphorbia lathyris TaxID=212925 RepID=UPI003313632D
MVERKVFKTKLCVLYQKGHCPRHNCSFAHGNAELRQSFGSYNGNRDRRGGDLRDKLDRRLSPRRKYSPGRDTRGWRTFPGSSPSRSFQKTGDKKRKKKEHFDEQSDFSGSLRSSDGAGDQVKRRKSVSTDSRIILKEQIKEVQSEINVLDQQKSQLRTLVKEKDEETDVLTSRIQELDAQLSKEKEEYKRIISKMKKFVKAHKRYVRVQEELKKSQVRLHKLGDELSSGTNIVGDNEEDSSVNIVSDGNPGSHAINLRNGAFNNSSLVENIVRAKHDGAEELRKGTNTRGKTSGWDAHPDSLKVNKTMVIVDNENDRHESVGNEVKQKKGRNVSVSISSSDKVKGSVFGVLAPSTSMAAHAINERVEIEVVESETGSAYEVRKLPFLLPPPPPILPTRTYSQNKGKDENENVDVEKEDVEIV